MQNTEPQSFVDTTLTTQQLYRTENIYFEATYDGDHRTLYLDSYLKKQDGGIAILTD